MDDRLVTATKVDEDAQYEAGLRPRVLDDYIGQDRVRENLQVSIAAALQRVAAIPSPFRGRAFQAPMISLSRNRRL